MQGDKRDYIAPVHLSRGYYNGVVYVRANSRLVAVVTLQTTASNGSLPSPFARRTTLNGTRLAKQTG